MSAPSPDVMHLAEVTLDDRLTLGELALIVGAGVGGFLAMAAVTGGLLYGAYRLEVRAMRRNREHTTGIRGALDNAAARGQR